jgi:WD40-like Beta Propeller Repeat
VAGPAADVPFRSRTLAKTIREPSGENVAECASRASRRRPVPSGAARVQLQRRALRDGRERREPSAAHAQPGDDGSPDWSPDGGRIAFSSNRNFPDGAGFEIYSIRPDSACLTWLTNGTPESTAPDWRPGAGASSDPGRCGDAARPALIETDVRDVARLEGSRPLWLGRSFRGLLLSGAERTRPGIFFRYDDCARYDPRECPEELHVSQASVCAPDSHLPFLTSNRERYSRRRGVRRRLRPAGRNRRLHVRARGPSELRRQAATGPRARTPPPVRPRVARQPSPQAPGAAAGARTGGAPNRGRT